MYIVKCSRTKRILSSTPSVQERSTKLPIRYKRVSFETFHRQSRKFLGEILKVLIIQILSIKCNCLTFLARDVDHTSTNERVMVMGYIEVTGGVRHQREIVANRCCYDAKTSSPNQTD